MFRNRVTKALRKSLATSTPIFRACADRLGPFLMSIPPYIGLDRSVMRDYNAYTTITAGLDSAEAEYNVAKTSNLGPTSPTKAGKWESRHARTNSINRVSSTNTTLELNPSSSSGPGASSNLPKLLTTFLEVDKPRFRPLIKFDTCLCRTSSQPASTLRSRGLLSTVSLRL